MSSAAVHKDTVLKNWDQKSLPAAALQKETFPPAASDTPGGRRKPETRVTSGFIHAFRQVSPKYLKITTFDTNTKDSILT